MERAALSWPLSDTRVAFVENLSNPLPQTFRCAWSGQKLHFAQRQQEVALWSTRGDGCLLSTAVARKCLGQGIGHAVETRENFHRGAIIELEFMRLRRFVIDPPASTESRLIHVDRVRFRSRVRGAST